MLYLTGALTSKAYAFTSRPWELRSTESIDILDGLGSNIRIDFKESEIVRILPKKNLGINENWISDKTRFFYDSIKRQRLVSPFFKKEGLLQTLKWKVLSAKLSSLFKAYTLEYGGSKIGFIVGSSVDTESLYAIKDFGLSYGFPVLSQKTYSKINIDYPENYKFQSLMKKFENVDYCMFLGTNPRFEASVFNLRLRKVFKRGSINYSSLGGNFVSTFPVNFLGLTATGLLQISEGKHNLCKKLIKAKTPNIVYGSTISKRFDLSGLQTALHIISSSVFVHTTKIVHINLLHTDANDVGISELGLKFFNKNSLKNFKLVYGVELHCNKILKTLSKNLASLLLVFQKSTGTLYTNMADLILPSTVFAEINGTFYNTEGTPQQTECGMLGLGLAKDNWRIIRLFFNLLGKPSLYSKKLELNKLTATMLPSIYWGSENSKFKKWNIYCSEIVFISYLKLSIEDFFMTHYLCFNSKVLAKASKSMHKNATNYGFLTSFC